MHRLFQNFIDHLSGATDLERLHDAMADTAAALDLSCTTLIAQIFPFARPNIQIGAVHGSGALPGIRIVSPASPPEKALAAPLI